MPECGTYNVGLVKPRRIWTYSFLKEQPLAPFFIRLKIVRKIGRYAALAALVNPAAKFWPNAWFSCLCRTCSFDTYELDNAWGSVRPDFGGSGSAKQIASRSGQFFSLKLTSSPALTRFFSAAAAAASRLKFFFSASLIYQQLASLIFHLLLRQLIFVKYSAVVKKNTEILPGDGAVHSSVMCTKKQSAPPFPLESF